jgi:hypothetical protein
MKKVDVEQTTNHLSKVLAEESQLEDSILLNKTNIIKKLIEKFDKVEFDQYSSRRWGKFFYDNDNNHEVNYYYELTLRGNYIIKLDKTIDGFICTIETVNNDTSLTIDSNENLDIFTLLEELYDKLEDRFSNLKLKRENELSKKILDDITNILL